MFFNLCKAINCLFKLPVLTQVIISSRKNIKSSKLNGGNYDCNKALEINIANAFKMFVTVIIPAIYFQCDCMTVSR
ncbi:MAG: hypothetical protein CTY34_08800 [Methylobacter sp.]|nr:MAG: hypothetical protein CTY34_08800 [Methylobacter sp.]PPD20931.1 MAG: hypothetical protein CTY24_08520 [Methylobacter sp.]